MASTTTGEGDTMRRDMRTIAIAALLATTACDESGEVERLEQRITALETERANIVSDAGAKTVNDVVLEIRLSTLERRLHRASVFFCDYALDPSPCWRTIGECRDKARDDVMCRTFDQAVCFDVVGTMIGDEHCLLDFDACDAKRANQTEDTTECEIR